MPWPAAGGVVRKYESPRRGALAGWIEAEARQRDLQLAPGAAKEHGRADRRPRRPQTTSSAATRPGSPRWSWTSSRSTRHGARSPPTTSGRSSPRPFPARSGRSPTPIGERRDRGRAGAPRPAPRRHAGTRPAGGPPPARPRAARAGRSAGRRRTPRRPPARAMGINSEFRAQTLAGQAKAWTTTELAAALDGLVELDAMVKGAPGSRAGRRAAATGVQPVGACDRADAGRGDRRELARAP